MTDRRALAEHLKFFGELGVQGVSRDPAWRERTEPGLGGRSPLGFRRRRRPRGRVR